MSRWRKIGIVLLLLCTAIGLPCMTYVLWPLPDSLIKQPLSTVVTDAEGNILAAGIASDEQWRFPVAKTLPGKYITALIVYEDKRFYQHPGIDPLAIARAMHTNIKKGKIVSGGSTLTMQLARLLRGNPARTYTAKLTEALLALKLEYHLTKQQILNYYAALAPFGGNTVGIHAANWRYYQLQLEDISWAQAALLAVLPNNPSSIHPGKNRKTLLNKRDRLLQRLAGLGYLSALDLKLAQLERLPKKPKPLPRYTPHLLTTLKQRFPEQYYFKTAIDLSLQQHLLELTDSYNQRYQQNNVNNLSVLVLDNESNHVIAYLGNQTKSSKREYASAVDIIQGPRSSGSLFKPFLFAMLLQKGFILPDSLVEDIPSYFNGYKPQNYDRRYRGLIPAKLALTQSLNVPAVGLLQQYGVAPFKDDLQALGLTTLWRPAEDYGLSLILGGAETTLWEITNSFARLMKSAQGYTHSATSAALHQGQAVEVQTYLVEQGAAWLTLQALLDVNRPGIAASWRNFSSSQKIAWKTGTSYGWHDAWAVGSNGRYTVGVWAGNANGEEARLLTGTQTAAPVMLDAFHYLSSGQWPSMPHHALKQYTVCKNDYYLSINGCDSVKADAPIDSDFVTVSPYHQQIHIDKTSNLRVHANCESPSNMRAISQFTIPSVHAWYYARSNTQLPAIPAWRQDCLQNLPAVDSRLPLAFEYPSKGSKVRIPVELDGKLGRIIVKAHHQQSDATIFWHLNDQFLDSTKHIHEQAIAVNPGWHQLTLTDNEGYRITRWFKAI